MCIQICDLRTCILEFCEVTTLWTLSNMASHFTLCKTQFVIVNKISYPTNYLSKHASIIYIAHGCLYDVSL